MQLTNRNRLILSIGIIAVVGLLIFSLLYFTMRSGKTRVSIAVVPSDSKVTLDGKQVKAGDFYLEPGSHTFLATKQGFSDDKQIVEVGDETLIVGLIPEPASDEAYTWLSKHPEAQTEREALGGMNANRKGTVTRDNNPLIKRLPYYDPEGLFAINYGVEKSRENGVFILINNSSPDGRRGAVLWIKRQGYDPTQLDIRFKDFVNPLTGKTQEGV